MTLAVDDTGSLGAAVVATTTTQVRPDPPVVGESSGPIWSNVLTIALLVVVAIGALIAFRMSRRARS